MPLSDLWKTEVKGLDCLTAQKQNTKQTYCVFNKARESFLSLNVTIANTHWSRLKGLLGKWRLKADEGVWIVPSQGIHTIGVPFAIDLIYLDADCRIMHMIESFSSFRIAPIRVRCASILELPPHTISSSQTRLGDQLWICPAEKIEECLQDDRPRQLSKIA